MTFLSLLLNKMLNFWPQQIYAVFPNDPCYPSWPLNKMLESNPRTMRIQYNIHVETVELFQVLFMIT